MAISLSPIPNREPATQETNTPAQSASKPNVPKRFVVPRLVKLQPKTLDRLSKWVKKPSRPAPAAPNSPEIKGAKVPPSPSNSSSGHGSPGSSGKGQTRVGGIQGRKKRMSVERPKVPPPRPPIAPSSRRSSESGSPGRPKPPMNRSMSEGYSNVLPNWDNADGQTYFSIVPIPDSDLKASARVKLTEHLSDKQPDVSSVRPVDIAEGASSPIDKHKHDGDKVYNSQVSNKTSPKSKSPARPTKAPPARPVMPVAPLSHKGSKTPPPMRLFSTKDEDSPEKGDSSLNLSDSIQDVSGEKRLPPPLPPKPDPQRLRYRRSKSDPNVMAIKSLALSRGPRPGEKYENVMISDLKPIPEKGFEKSDSSKVEGKVPPGRPKERPRRSLPANLSKPPQSSDDFASVFKSDVSFAENEINEILLTPVQDADDKMEDEENRDVGHREEELGEVRVSGEGDDSDVFLTPQTRLVTDDIYHDIDNSESYEERDSDQGSSMLPRPITPPRSVSPVKRAKSPHHKRPKSSSPSPDTRDSGNGSLPTSPRSISDSRAVNGYEPDLSSVSGLVTVVPVVQSPSQLQLEAVDTSNYYTPVSSMAPPSERLEYSPSFKDNTGTSPESVTKLTDSTLAGQILESSIDNSPPKYPPTTHSSNLSVNLSTTPFVTPKATSPTTSPGSGINENSHLRFFTPAKFVSKYSPPKDVGEVRAVSPDPTESTAPSTVRVISPVPAVGSDGKFVSRPVNVDFSTPRPYFRSPTSPYSVGLSSTEELMPPARRDYSRSALDNR